MMDEDAVGLLGILLIVTGLILTHQLQTAHAARMASLHWQDVVAGTSCGHDGQQDCTLAFAR